MLGSLCYKIGENLLAYKRTGEERGRLIYRTGDKTDDIGILKRMMVMTEWRFSNQEKNVQALINDEVVCPGHSTYHIVQYPIFTGKASQHYNPASERYEVYFTMSATGIGRYGCVFACWDSKYKSYSAAPNRSKAMMRGNGRTIARFMASYDPKTNIYRITRA